MNKYRKGANFEREVINFLREKGYYVCRSAGSKGLNDLIVIPLCHSVNNSRPIFKTQSLDYNEVSFRLHPSVIQLKTWNLPNVLPLLQTSMNFAEQKFYPKINKYIWIKQNNIWRVFKYDATQTFVWTEQELL